MWVSVELGLKIVLNCFYLIEVVAVLSKYSPQTFTLTQFKNKVAIVFFHKKAYLSLKEATGGNDEIKNNRKNNQYQSVSSTVNTEQATQKSNRQTKIHQRKVKQLLLTVTDKLIKSLQFSGIRLSIVQLFLV